MAKILIFEGPDCSGKTTMIASLKKHNWFQKSIVVKSNYRPLSGLISDIEAYQKIQYEILDRFAQMKSVEYIFYDRSFFSEIVYSVLRDPSSKIKTKMRDFKPLIEYLSAGTEYAYIQLMPPYEIVENVWKKRGDDYIQDAQTLKLIYKRYQRLYKLLELKNKYLYRGSKQFSYDKNTLHRNIKVGSFHKFLRKQKVMQMVNSEDFTFTSDGKNIMKQIVSEQMKLAKKYRDIEGMGNILDTTNENLNTKEGQVWIKDFLSRASEEIAESYEAYDKEGYKIEHVIEELADSLHFLVEAAIIAGIHKNLPEPFHMDDKDFTDINFKTINEYYLDIFVHIGLTKKIH